MTLHSCFLQGEEELKWPDSEGPDRILRENTEVREDKIEPGFCVSAFSVFRISCFEFLYLSPSNISREMSLADVKLIMAC